MGKTTEKTTKIAASKNKGSVSRVSSRARKADRDVIFPVVFPNDDVLVYLQNLASFKEESRKVHIVVR